MDSRIQIAVAVIVILVGGIAIGYGLADGDSDDVSEKLREYADGLNAHGGVIYSSGSINKGISVSAGSSVSVNGDELVVALSSGTYHFPYTGIGFVVIYR